jgi:hypothetical protein
MLPPCIPMSLAGATHGLSAEVRPSRWLGLNCDATCKPQGVRHRPGAWSPCSQPCRELVCARSKCRAESGALGRATMGLTECHTDQ